ncbi:Monoamine oxidase A [Fusarium agapanthi]|uniref:monoamine oxidase n=1 Tax=Fusarium agapanthi TaxID=1803897 RepID=A0A9P5E4X4_9HYPO|nr:Monoamine oxidase A [Fusarium agapanthi]
MWAEGEDVSLLSAVINVARTGDPETRGRMEMLTNVSDTLRIQAQKVIVAIPPKLAGRIVFRPPLPTAHDQLCQRAPMGSIGKVIAIYKTPLWRDQGLNGEVSSPEETNEMRRLDDAPEEEILVAVTEDFVIYFGPKAREVQSWALQM